jgi:hypothetical protein
MAIHWWESSDSISKLTIIVSISIVILGGIGLALKIQGDRIKKKADAPRRLTQEQRSEFTKLLQGVPKVKVAFNANPFVTDSEGLATDLAQAMNEAGFTVESIDHGQIVPPYSFITVGTFGENNSPSDKAVVDALIKIGFPAHLQGGINLRPGVMYIAIGKKSGAQ